MITLDSLGATYSSSRAAGLYIVRYQVHQDTFDRLRAIKKDGAPLWEIMPAKYVYGIPVVVVPDDEPEGLLVSIYEYACTTCGKLCGGTLSGSALALAWSALRAGK